MNLYGWARQAACERRFQGRDGPERDAAEISPSAVGAICPGTGRAARAVHNSETNCRGGAPLSLNNPRNSGVGVEIRPDGSGGAVVSVEAELVSPAIAVVVPGTITSGAPTGAADAARDVDADGAPAGGAVGGPIGPARPKAAAMAVTMLVGPAPVPPFPRAPSYRLISAL